MHRMDFCGAARAHDGVAAWSHDRSGRPSAAEHAA
jgi:hypothetical protein